MSQLNGTLQFIVLTATNQGTKANDQSLVTVTGIFTYYIEAFMTSVANQSKFWTDVINPESYNLH